MYFVWLKGVQWRFLEMFQWIANLNSCGGKSSSLKRSWSLSTVSLMLAKPRFYWWKSQASMWGLRMSRGSKGLLFPSASCFLELQKVLQNKGVKVEHGNRPPDPFSPLAHSLLTLDVSLHDAFCWQSSFQGTPVTAELATGSSWVSWTERPKHKVHKYSFVYTWFTSGCAGRSCAGKHGVHLHVSLGCPFLVPSATFPGTTVVTPSCPSLHAHAPPNYPARSQHFCIYRLLVMVCRECWHCNRVYQKCASAWFWHNRDSAALPQQHKVLTAQQGTVEKSLRYSILQRNWELVVKWWRCTPSSLPWELPCVGSAGALLWLAAVPSVVVHVVVVCILTAVTSC